MVLLMKSACCIEIRSLALFDRKRISLGDRADNGRGQSSPGHLTIIICCPMVPKGLEVTVRVMNVRHILCVVRGNVSMRGINCKHTVGTKPSLGEISELYLST